MSNIVPFSYLAENSEATPGLFNSPLSALSSSIANINANLGSGLTMSILSDVSTGGGVFTAGPSNLSGVVTIHSNSNVSDYLSFVDSANARSNYLLGSHIGGTADGLNLYDNSGATMIVSFSKQSVRFFQTVVGPVFDVGGALTDTYNAATYGNASQSVESRIQAAISAASTAGIAHVYVPASMYPYSAASVSFDTRVQMVREGGDWSVFDVIAYGANGNGSTASAAANNNALQSAISGANADPHNTGLAGGRVFVPPGRYVISKTINVPVVVNQGQVILSGAGMRVSYLYPQTSCLTAILFGAATPDVSQTATNETFYCGMEDLSVSGSLITDAVCAVQMTEMQKGWMRNNIIESFNTKGAIGLYLRGSTTNSGGVGAVAAPHNWRCGFQNVIVATTYRPLIIENGDENDFFNCNFQTPPGLTSATTAVHIVQGRNNRFFGLELGGDSSSITTGRPNYTGMLLTAPTNGDNLGTQMYGGVLEGFDSGISIGAGVNNSSFLFYNTSINSVDINDAGNRTLLYETGGLLVPLWQHPDGTAAGPAFAFRSEGSLGWYRSGTSVMNLGPTGRLQVGSSAAFSLKTQPEYGFGGESQLGMLRSAASAIGFYASGTRLGQFLAAGGLGALWVEVGSSTSPGIGWALEPTLGFYRSGASAVGIANGYVALTDGSTTTNAIAFASDISLGFFKSAQSTIGLSPEGRLVVGSAAAFSLKTQPEYGFGGEPQLGMLRSSASAIGFYAGNVRLGQFLAAGGLGALWVEVGSATSPGVAYALEPKLGWYRSGASTMALSYGTVDFTGSGAVTSIASLTIKSGTNNSCGTAVLGSNGSVNVANTYVKTGDLIFLTDMSPGGTIGSLEILGIRNASGFTIASTNVADTSTVGWLIVHPS